MDGIKLIKQCIALDVRDGLPIPTVEAEVCDGLALHETPGLRDFWSITHVASGRVLCTFGQRSMSLAAMREAVSSDLDWTLDYDKFMIVHTRQQLDQVWRSMEEAAGLAYTVSTALSFEASQSLPAA
jgi:hypothetical protein